MRMVASSVAQGRVLRCRRATGPSAVMRAREARRGGRSERRIGPSSGKTLDVRASWMRQALAHHQSAQPASGCRRAGSDRRSATAKVSVQPCRLSLLHSAGRPRVYRAPASARQGAHFAPRRCRRRQGGDVFVYVTVALLLVLLAGLGLSVLVLKQYERAVMFGWG